MSRTAAFLAAACLVGATAARADDTVFPGFAHGSQTVTYAVSAPNVARTGTVSAGGFLTSINGGPSFVSYCVDLYQTMSFGTHYTDFVDVGGGHLFANPDAYADIGTLYSIAGVVNSAVREAAFQIAVWEIAYETAASYDLGLGSARFSGGTAASSGALTLASSWLSLLGSGPAGPSLRVLESGVTQDVITTPIPEPATVMLMLAGLGGIGAAARRRAAGRAQLPA